MTGTEYKLVKVDIFWDDDVDIDDEEEYEVTDEFDRPSYMFVKFPLDVWKEITKKELMFELEDLYGFKVKDIRIFAPSVKVLAPRMKTLIWTEKGLVGA